MGERIVRGTIRIGRARESNLGYHSTAYNRTKRWVGKGGILIAALFVHKNGPYFGLPNVDPWDEERDARLYAGPHPIVAHPPCERWGRYWSGGPSAKVRRELGDDGGCFKQALRHVRIWGGVLEHPADSLAWRFFNIARPLRVGGWHPGGAAGGWTCHVEQGHYGHRARKATWLYASGVELPELIWGPSESRVRLDEGFHSARERREARAAGRKAVERLSKRQRICTPDPFRDLLISIASTARRR